MLISVDTECTGLDVAHGARPFIVTICRDDGKQMLWEWDVDPITRAVLVPQEDVEDIRREVDAADEIVGQNLRFDAKMVQAAGVIEDWPWQKTHDTLIASHLLASAMPHDLTSLVLHYTGHDIKPYEDRLRDVVQAARRRVKGWNKAETSHSGLFEDEASTKWRVAEEGDPMMPSASSDAWHFDYWLPRTMAKHLGLPPDDINWTACSRYANADSAYTLLLWSRMSADLSRMSLRKIYEESMRLPRIIAGMEMRGVSYDIAAGERLRMEYKAEANEFADRCITVARSIGYDLDMPRGAGVNGSLRRFCFGYDDCTCEDCGATFHGKLGAPHECKARVNRRACKSRKVKVERRLALDLPIVSLTDAGEPSLDAEAMVTWEQTLIGPQLEFVQSLAAKRKRETTAGQLESYSLYGYPSGVPGYVTLHPNLNQTGTAHLRMSSNNPNSQNCGKQKRPCNMCRGRGDVGGIDCSTCKGEGEVDFNVRRPFRPLPGREFWAHDFENIELRIPAYEAGEELMIALFEKPDEGPFWGSQHLLNASIAYPDLFWPLADKKGAFKKEYASTWYQWMKNTDFALSYECGEAKCDATAHREGTYRLLKSKFANLAKLSASYIDFARKRGYVETIPDRTVDPSRGYPMMTQRSSRGDVSPTIPFCYHVSGTAMWCTRKAMVRCQAQLDEWNADVLRAAGLYDATQRTRARYIDQHGYHISLQIHDELLFDFPAGGKRNWARAMRLNRLMEESGTDIGIPLKVAASWHPKTWATSEELFPKEAAA